MSLYAKPLRWAALALAAAVLCLYTPPNLPLCGYRFLTGHLCPLCGLTHAFFALAKGRVGEALRLNALSPLAVVMIVGTFFAAPRISRLWTPCLAAFATYGLWRIIAR